jgi:hypothetical protein
VAYSMSNLGSGGGPGGGLNYMLCFAPAAGVGVAMLAATSPAGQVAASLAITAVGLTNVAGIAHGRAAWGVGLQGYGPEIARMLEREGVTRGYASFWDAHSLTWNSGMRLLVVPVRECHARGGPALCPKRFFTIDSWYDTWHGRSFLIVNGGSELEVTPPRSFVRPSEVHRFGTNIAVYIYPHDLAGYLASSEREQ